MSSFSLGFVKVEFFVKGKVGPKEKRRKKVGDEMVSK